MIDMSIVTVPGEGPLECKIAFVGEAPGETEERERKPFVGRTGDLFNSLTKTASINRNACYITNVVKQRPPGNNIERFFKFEKGTVKKSPLFDEYVDTLREELSACTANIIVALGQTALYALTGIPDKISKRRGSIYESTLLPGRKVLACLHPSSALRMYMNQRLILFDLRRALEHSATPDLPVDDRVYILDPSFEEVVSYLDALALSAKRTACDIEVINGEVSMISFSFREKEAICIPFISGSHDNYSLEEEADIWDKIAMILENPLIVKVGQNFSFDSTFLHRKYGIVSRNIEDTMVAQAICMPEYPKGLDFIASIYSDIPYYKDEGKKWMKGVGGDELGFRLYNAKDSIVVNEAFDLIMEDVKRLGNLETYKRQVELVPILSYMAERGIRMDTVGLNEMAENALTQMTEIQAEVNKIVGYEINCNSSPQVADYFYIKKKLPVYTKDGSITTDEEALRRIARKGFREAELIIRMRELRKAYGTYYTVKLEEGRLKCSFNPVGAADSGRLSSSKTIFGTGTNTQNQPEDMKDMMMADIGYMIFEMDLSQAENRIVAYIAPEPRMIWAFENDVDVHKSTATFIYNVSIDAITFEQRKKGKHSNHSLNYDMGFDSFSRKYMLPLNEGRMIYDKYHRAYPGVHKYHAWIREALGVDRKLTNLMGRTRLFLDRWGDTLFKSAYSFIPQSTVADVINERGLEYIWNDPDMQPVEILNQVHDSIVFQIPVSVGWVAISLILIKIKKSLETPLHWKGNEFVIPANLKAGRRLGKHSKEIAIDENLTSNLEQIWRETEE